MERVQAAFSLRWKFLAWFFVNLLVLGGVIFLFLRVQFHVGITSLLAGATSDRLEAVAAPLAAELRQLPESGWSEALDDATAGWRARGLRVALYHDDGRYIAGEIPNLPDEVRRTLQQHDLRNHAGGGRPPRPRDQRPPGEPGGPDDGPPFRPDRAPPNGPPRGFGPPDADRGPGPGPEDGPGVAANSDEEPNRSGGAAGPGFGPRADDPNRGPRGERGSAALRLPTRDVGPLDKFMQVTRGPTLYWAGIHLGELRRPVPGTGSPSITLLIASPSLRGGGLFFDYVPWLVLGGALVAISALFWLPFIGGLTGMLSRMTLLAEGIAQGRFGPPSAGGSRRRDELGRLSRALGHMSIRLEGLIKGQRRFLGDTAHELLSPLARLEVALSILEQKALATDDPEEGRYSERALAEVRHISALVYELLSFTKADLRTQPVELRPTALAPLVRAAAEREAAEHRVDIEIADDCSVQAAPELLQRAVGNVIRNAVRYAGDAGPIRVRADNGPEESGRPTVLLEISDQGPGVPEDAIDRLFDPFFRPETARTRETGGVGLGLAIVKSCVETCGGRVAARNLVPHGLEVTLTLLRADSSPQRGERFAVDSK